MADATLDLATVWDQIRERLATSLSPQQNAMLNLTRPLGLVEDTAVLAAPNEFTQTVLESRMRRVLAEALSEQFGRDIRPALVQVRHNLIALHTIKLLFSSSHSGANAKATIDRYWQHVRYSRTGGSISLCIPLLRSSSMESHSPSRPANRLLKPSTGAERLCLKSAITLSLAPSRPAIPVWSRWTASWFAPAERQQ